MRWNRRDEIENESDSLRILQVREDRRSSTTDDVGSIVCDDPEIGRYGPIDADNCRTQIAEHHGCKRPRPHSHNFYDANAG